MSRYLYLAVVVLSLKSSQGFQGFHKRGESALSTRYTLASSNAVFRRPSTISLYLSKQEDSPQEEDEPLSFLEMGSDVGDYDPTERLQPSRQVNVGDPQIRLQEKERSVTSILKELAAIQQQGPQKYCILGTRHCSYLHQQIIELLCVRVIHQVQCIAFLREYVYLMTFLFTPFSRHLLHFYLFVFILIIFFIYNRAYALVLSGNHVYTSGAGGTHSATIRGALRAERDDLLTVVLPQSMGKQPKESQELLKKVDHVIAMPQNDDMSLDIASRICNSYLLSQTDQLISFAFHESSTVIEATKEAKKLEMLVTTLYLD
jgi:hypothetical protein